MDTISERICVIVVKLPDDSIVKFLTTTNKEILESLDLPIDDKLYDLETLEEIPEEYWDYIEGYEETDKIKYDSKLDQMLHLAAKIRW